jgi:hypothetical protein
LWHKLYCFFLMKCCLNSPDLQSIQISSSLRLETHTLLVWPFLFLERWSVFPQSTYSSVGPPSADIGCRWEREREREREGF